MVVESIKKRRRDGGGEEEGEELGKKLEERMEGIRALFRRSAEGKWAQQNGDRTNQIGMFPLPPIVHDTFCDLPPPPYVLLYEY